MFSGWSPTFEAILVVDPLSFTARASLMLLGLAYITDSPYSIDRVGVRLVFNTLPSEFHFQIGEIWIISSTAAPLKLPDRIRIEDIYRSRCAGHPARIPLLTRAFFQFNSALIF